MRLLVVMIVGSLLFSSCVMKKKEPVQPLDTNSLVHQVKVDEVIQTTSYTYLKVMEAGQEYWIAVTRMDAKAGDNFYFESGLEMVNFESKELSRTFDRVLFVDKISDTPDMHSAEMPHSMEGHSGKKTVAAAEDITIEPVAGGVTIGELFKNRADYADKQVLVKGKAVKVNKNIMGKNWVHIQDGTSDGDNFDLTFTTAADVNVGDVVAIEGKVTLDKDFGAGYFYELIVEEASVK